MPDLVSCLNAPLHTVPTVNFTVRNLEAPLNQEEYDFLTQSEINFFSTTQSDRTGAASAYSKSRNVTDQTMTFDTPFVLLGICIYAYGEPNGMTVPGNNFHGGVIPSLPASPLTLRNNAALQAGLFAEGAVPDGVEICPARLEWGIPTWRAIWAFMHAFRLQMRCPNSAYELLIDESLADLGNCCSQFDYQGYSSLKQGHIRLAQRVNHRLHEETMPTQTGVTDAGIFVPINAEQHADGEIVPYNLAPDFTALGRPETEGAVEQWYRLPCPIPFIPSTKIKMTLKVGDSGDQPYLVRMLEELTMAQCISPVPDLNGGACNFPIAEDGVAADPDGGIACETYLPGGKLRIGIGLKGFEVRGGCADELAEMVVGKSFAEIAAKYPGLVNPGGQVYGPQQSGASMCMPVGSLGDPGVSR